MTNADSIDIFQNYVDRILYLARPRTNDTRYASYARYINEFLKFFGTEKCFLVGSSAEKTNLTWSKDDGDADFLMVSGKLNIPAEEIETRSDNPCFVWIRGERLNIHDLEIELIDGDDGKKYLPACLLRDADPRMFTFLRGVLKFICRTTDSFPSERTNHRMTATRATSKVGLERTQFRNLKIIEKNKIPQLRKYIPKKLLPRKPKSKEIQPSCVGKYFGRVLKLFAIFNTPGSTSEHQSNFEHFANVVKLLLDSWREEKDTASRELIDETDGDNTDDDDFERFVNDLDFPSDVKATYKEKFMADFVPALRVDGKLKCMDQWYKRHRNWPSEHIVEEIYNNDFYVIAKVAPFDGDKKDFCLAFNHAELLLAECLTQTQRTCYVLVKAYYKGMFEKIIEKIPTTRRLKTFHLKTVFYWVLESTGDTSLWWEENLVEALKNVLTNLKEALQTKILRHYFTEANLFMGFDSGMCSELVYEIDKILENPVRCLQSFFDLENQGDIEITLTDDQVQTLIDMSKDGGVENEADIIEDIMEDFSRGFREAPTNENIDTTIKQALNHIIEVVLEDETKRKTKTDRRKGKENYHQRMYLGQELAEAASVLVFDDLNESDRKSIEGNLKQKGLSYFLEEPLD